MEDRERSRVALAESDGCWAVPQPAHEQGVPGAVHFLESTVLRTDMSWIYLTNYGSAASMFHQKPPLSEHFHQKASSQSPSLPTSPGSPFSPTLAPYSDRTTMPPHTDLARASVLLYHHHHYDTHGEVSCHFQSIVLAKLYPSIHGAIEH